MLKSNNIAVIEQIAANKQIVSTYDAETGLLYMNYFTQKDQSLSVPVDISPDGKLVACGLCNINQGIRIWYFKSGKQFLSLSAPADINMVQFSPDNKYIAGACGNNNVYIWNSSTGKLIHTLKGLDDMVMTLDFSPDGKSISANCFDCNCAFKTWSIETGVLLQTIGERGATIQSINYHPKGNSLAVAYRTYGDYNDGINSEETRYFDSFSVK